MLFHSIRVHVNHIIAYISPQFQMGNYVSSEHKEDSSPRGTSDLQTYNPQLYSPNYYQHQPGPYQYSPLAAPQTYELGS